MTDMPQLTCWLEKYSGMISTAHIASQIVADSGGLAELSKSHLQLIRRFAAASCMSEQLEAKMAQGGEIDITQHALLVSTMVRISARIGVDRVPRDVTDGPSAVEFSRTFHHAHLDEHGEVVIDSTETPDAKS